MKYLYSFLLLFVTFHTSAQKHLVLVEEFTNTGCNPCASWSPILDEVIDFRLGDCIAIKYHSGYPDREDVFYNYDATSQQTRHDFYGVDGVPATFVNGTEIGDRTYEMMNTAIDYFLAQPLDYSLNVSKELNNHHLAVRADLTPTTQSVNTDRLRLFIAVIEEHLTPTIPCSNGEQRLHYTLRKLMTGGNGVQIDKSRLEVGETFTYNGEWDIDFMNDEGQLGVVAFLQNMDTRQVLCTAYSEPGCEQENRLTAMRISDTPDLICVSNYYGKVLFRNNGSNTLTSATLNVEVNGTVKQYPWSGTLNYLERDTMAFDNFTDFDLSADENQVNVWFSDINGTEAVSNSLSSTFANSIQATYGVRLRLYTDKKPEETTWKVYNSAGDVVQEGGPYTEARKIHNIDLELTYDDCYMLEFEDAGGDGIKGAYGNGYYQLFQIDADGKTTRIAQGDYEGSLCDVYFNLTGTPKKKKRLVLFEEFTNTSCAPCSEFSPSLDKTIYERMGDMVAITYHGYFPSKRDPFYLANTVDAMARLNYYDVTGVPSLRVDGEHAGARGYEEYLDSYIDIAGDVPPQMDIDTEASLNDGMLTVDVSLTPNEIADGSNLRLYVAAVEERVEWADPAPNGEKSWNYVMRKLLPDAQGQPLPAELPQSVPTHYEFTWQVAHYDDENELGLVTFVQDNTTKKVLGACYTPRPTGSEHAVKILGIDNMPDRICTPQFICDLTVRNTGHAILSSATLNVRINGQLQATPWTGRLEYLDIATLHTPLFSDFTLTDGTLNEVEIWISDLNGSSEESLHKTLTLANAHKAQNAVRLTLMTDNAPEEITWKVYNSAGDEVCAGGPYTEKRKKQVVDLPLSEDDCYRLEFEDTGGNGITGENGRGYYMLHEVNAEGQTRLLVQADYTGATHNVFFSLQNASLTGIQPVTATQDESGQLYDLQGRKVSQPLRGIYIKDSKKLINK